MSDARNGYAVQITREDGSTFLASSGHGVLPSVWTLSNRKYAVRLKRDLEDHIDPKRMRVVRVTFTDPEVQQ